MERRAVLCLRSAPERAGGERACKGCMRFPEGAERFRRRAETRFFWAFPAVFLIISCFSFSVFAAPDTSPVSFIAGSSDREAPKITDARVTAVTEKQYTVAFTVSDNVAVTSVKLPTWYLFDKQKKTLKWIRLGPQEGRVSYTIRFSDFGGREGLYVTDVYAYDAEGNYTTVRLCAVRSAWKYLDQISPSIYNVQVNKNGTKGYTLSFDVSDNLRVVWLQISTWYEADYLRTVRWTTLSAGEGHVSKKVNFSGYGGLAGTYVTKIYAYDLAGNEGSKIIRVEKKEG